MRLVGTAAFKAVERQYPLSLVGSIPIHSRHFLGRRYHTSPAVTERGIGRGSVTS